MICLFKHKPMNKDVSEIDVCHSDGERHEERRGEGTINAVNVL